MKTVFPRFSDDSATRVFLACLPALFAASTPAEALVCGLWTVGALGAAAVFFILTAFLFPAKFRETALYLWLAVTAQIFFRPAGLHPVLIVSVFLLIPRRLFMEGARAGVIRQTLMRVIFFPLVFVLLGAFHEMLGERLRVWSFQLPAGGFLLLAAAALLWQNQPGRKTKRSAV